MSTRQKLTGQQRVLAILVKEDGLIQSQLAEILDIRPSSLAELMKKMEKSNDVLRKEEEHDKRIKRVFLTEKGRQKAKKISHVGEDMSEAFFAGLTEEEQENFSEYLQKISIMIFVETFGAILTAITDQTKRKVQKIHNGTIFNIERKLVSYK